MRRRSTNHDRIIFNGHDLSSLVMCRMERPIMAPVEVSAGAIGGRHGEVFRRARMQAYTVPVTVWIRSNDRRRVAEMRHRLAAMLWTEEPAPLYLPDDPTRYHLAVVDGDTNLGAITDDLPTTTINFRVCDPIAYGNSRTAALATGDETHISAGGTWESAPVVRSTTAGGTWRVRNATTNEVVEINADTVGGSISGGLAVVCDMANERLTLNGIDVGVTADTDFFTIEGNVAIVVTGGVNTQMEWHERWM